MPTVSETTERDPHLNEIKRLKANLKKAKAEIKALNEDLQIKDASIKNLVRLKQQVQTNLNDLRSKELGRQ